MQQSSKKQKKIYRTNYFTKTIFKILVLKSLPAYTKKIFFKTGFNIYDWCITWYITDSSFWGVFSWLESFYIFSSHFVCSAISFILIHIKAHFLFMQDLHPLSDKQSILENIFVLLLAVCSLVQQLFFDSLIKVNFVTLIKN